MKRWLNITSQIVFGSGQIVNLAFPILDDKQRVFVAVILGMAQLIISALAHEFNPDGSAAAQPYQKPSLTQPNP